MGFRAGSTVVMPERAAEPLSRLPGALGPDRTGRDVGLCGDVRPYSGIGIGATIVGKE